ncbi:bile acid-sensitive ion channel-like [Clavelina lepadiformis]|uniref:bile acid-sensitive ion channel-like n=1 Tax=Clavelina lepadiformis TaxID=159417 RepID=UPI004042A147
MTRSKKRKKKPIDIRREFAENTSFHGVHQIYTTWRRPVVVFWLTLLIVVLGLLIYQVTLRVLDYATYRTTTQISEEFVYSLPFPAITICNYNRYFNLTSEGERNDADNLSYSLDYGKPRNLSYFDSLGESFSLRKFMIEKGWPMKTNVTLFHCDISSSISCNESYFEPVLTHNLGLCWTFHTEQSQRIAGHSHGIHMSLNVLQSEFTENPIFGKWEAGIKFQVHSPDVLPQVDVYGQSVGVGLWASAAIHKIQTEHMYAPWGQCEREQQSLKFHSQYSLVACMRECHDERLIANCTCRGPSLSHYNETRECTVQEVAECVAPTLYNLQYNVGPKECGCTQPCNEIRYLSLLSYTTFPSQRAAEGIEPLFNVSYDYLKTNLVGLSVYFDTLSHTKSVESKAVEESALISDIGGQLGLWAGISVVTLVEVVQFAISMLDYRCESKKDKRRRRRRGQKKTTTTATATATANEPVNEATVV